LLSGGNRCPQGHRRNSGGRLHVCNWAENAREKWWVVVSQTLGAAVSMGIPLKLISNLASGNVLQTTVVVPKILFKISRRFVPVGSCAVAAPPDSFVLFLAPKQQGANAEARLLGRLALPTHSFYLPSWVANPTHAEGRPAARRKAPSRGFER